MLSLLSSLIIVSVSLLVIVLRALIGVDKRIRHCC